MNRRGRRKRSKLVCGQQISTGQTVGCALAVRGLWEDSLGVVAIDWVDDRSAYATELRAGGLNVQSGPHKPALLRSGCR